MIAVLCLTIASCGPGTKDDATATNSQISVDVRNGDAPPPPAGNKFPQPSATPAGLENGDMPLDVAIYIARHERCHLIQQDCEGGVATLARLRAKYAQNGPVMRKLLKYGDGTNVAEGEAPKAPTPSDGKPIGS